MRTRTLLWLLSFGGVAALLALLGPMRGATAAENGQVTLQRLPNGAIQPQAVVDSKGIAHIIYFRAGPTEGLGDLYYVRIAPGDSRPPSPIRVNSERNSAGCVGTVRTAQIALGEGDRVHVVWNGLGPKGPNGYPTAYEAYTRLNDAGTAFEPQRNLITWAKGVDGGGSVAADRQGDVYVMWHALANAKDEAGRAVFVARSTDNGATFARETRANPDPTGACGCCGMRAFIDDKGVLYAVYRTATNKVERDTALLVSRDKGLTFSERRLHPWHIDACPMSTYALAETNGRVMAAWETAGRVFAGAIDPLGLTVSGLSAAPGADEKHPFVTSAPNGQTLLTWTEGTGWQRGGALAWELIDRNGKVVSTGRKPGAVPVWGLATAYAKPDGTFVIVY
jgi:hypothetical protein